MNSIVLDCSALLPLFLQDESDDYSRAILQQAAKGTRLLTASFCLLEFGNVITVAVRRGRRTETQAAQAHKNLFLLPLEFRDFVEHSTMTLIHNLAQRRNLSFYDATYLALAMEEGAKLASLDARLMAAARAEGVEVEDNA